MQTCPKENTYKPESTSEIYKAILQKQATSKVLSKDVYHPWSSDGKCVRSELPHHLMFLTRIITCNWFQYHNAVYSFV